MTLTTNRRDRVGALVVATGFSLALGIATVAIPLLALASGYDAPAVGFLAATAALTQLGARLTLPWLLGRFPDRVLVAAATALLLSAFAILLGSTVLPAFVAAQLCQGGARALFWTASQTHVIRGGGNPVQRLVDLNLAGTIGTLTGPVLGGSLAVLGLPLAIAAAGLAAALALVATPLLARFPPYDRRRSAGTLRLLRRDGVDVACWGNLAGGTWWSMIGSYIPVVLVGAGLGPALIGLLVTLSEASGAGTLLVLRRMSRAWIRRLVHGGAFVEMAALTGIALAPPSVPVYAALLIAGGAAAGAVTALAPALISLASSEHEQGDALALSGVFRSIALLAAPATVGALLAVVALPVALAGVAVAAAAPGLLVGRGRSA